MKNYKYYYNNININIETCEVMIIYILENSTSHTMLMSLLEVIILIHLMRYIKQQSS